ncbi:MAG: AMP-binding protein [Actinomycetota bacterium]|nr:AMP-binding protein [Actinomycetota bacterium]
MDIDVTNLRGRRAINRWERNSIGDVIERVTWSYPDKEAIVGWDGAYGHPEFARLTYRQADELANRFANALLSRGLVQSDRVLLFCENSVEAFISKIAIAKAGGVAVPLNPSLASDVVAELISRTKPRFSIVDSELWIRAKEPFFNSGLGVDVTIAIGGGAVEASVTFADFVEGQPSTEPDTIIHGDDIWEILFTSGTTALPKGAMISHSSSIMGAYSFALTLTRGIHIECDLKLATFLPIIYHVADQVFTLPAFISGGTLLIGRRPVAESIAAAITKEKVTALWAGSPAMVNALAKEVGTTRSDYDISSLKVIVYGWAALPPPTHQILKERAGNDLVAVEIFGQTECISCHRFWPDKWPEVYERTAPEHNYVGVPNPMLASKVVDAMGDSLEGKPWIAGEAVYRSPSVTAGYYLDPSATAEAFRDGWFHSGDSCVYDEQGLRIMVDRFKDIVKSGGENVSTIRVEAILHLHPGVVKAAVIGVPDDRWGEAVTAVVVRTDNGATSEEEIIAFCRARLAGFETPKSVIFVESLPETVGGKVLKYKLRQQFR